MAPPEVAPEVFDAQSEFARKYIRNDVQQWLNAGCKL